MTRKRDHHKEGLKKRYGITTQDYNNMLARQRGKCGICARYRKLVVDHNHRTGKLRGLLCSNCNTGFGLLEESPRILKRAIQYYKTHKGG